MLQALLTCNRALLLAVSARGHPELATGGVMLAGESAVTGLIGVDVGRLSALTLKGRRTLLMT